MATTKKARPKYPPRRNAAPPRPPAPRSAKGAKPPASAGLRFAVTAGGALAASALGALAANRGMPPLAAAGILALGGGLLAWKGPGEHSRTAGTGAASAGGSQLMLLALQTPPARPKIVANQNQATAAPAPARLKNADIEALPPGALDAAFERARAELALGAHFDGLDGVADAA
jgi:hypothetical protein